MNINKREKVREEGGRERELRRGQGNQEGKRRRRGKRRDSKMTMTRREMGKGTERGRDRQMPGNHREGRQRAMARGQPVTLEGSLRGVPQGSVPRPGLLVHWEELQPPTEQIHRGQKPEGHGHCRPPADLRARFVQQTGRNMDTWKSSAFQSEH